LIVPVVIGGGGLWFNRQQQERQQADNQRQQERALEVESQHAQDAALQAYLDQLSQLLLDKNKPLSETQPGDNLRVVARARTLTILPSLDRGRKANILQFLYEAHLISRGHSVVSLKGAFLSEAYLGEAYLSGADLNGARLRGAYLIGAELIDADLGEADLTHADLSEADLTGARVTYEQLAKYRTLENATMLNGQKYEDWLEDDKKGRERN
jgi:hypothetical protein